MAGGVLFAKLLLLLLLALNVTAQVGASRKLLMFPRPGYGYGTKPGYGYGMKPGYGYGSKPTYGRPTYGAPPARQAPPTSGFPGPAIAMDPTQLEAETVTAAMSDHELRSVDVSGHSNKNVSPGKVERQLME